MNPKSRINFCLLSGENYLSKSLLVYRSLDKQCKDFRLYYFCFDDAPFELINKLKKQSDLYEYLIPIKKEDYITDELRKVSSTRTEQEFYWTLTPTVTKYALLHYNLQNITYLDADLYFYDNPRILIEELKEKSVLITRHNYSEEFKHLLYAGEYCIQFNTFLDNKESVNVLETWRLNCNDWCYLKHEDGKFGDQGYLNEWPGKYKNVHVLKNAGGGVAPWNIKKFNLIKEDISKYLIRDRMSKSEHNIVFYHFQSVKVFFNVFFYIGGYKIPKIILRELYLPYFKELKSVSKELRKVRKSIKPLGSNNKIKSIPFLFFNLLKNNVLFLLR